VLIARYDSRWTIETATRGQGHVSEKPATASRKPCNGQSRSGSSPKQSRYVVRLYATPKQTDERRRQGPWYRQKTTISYNDMLTALRRELIRQDFWAQAHQHHNTKLTNPQPPISAAA